MGSAAAVPTAHAARYVAQLCRHWEHKLVIERAGDDARVVLLDGSVVHLRPGAEALDVTIEAADAEKLDVAKGVVVRHLDRFAFREAPLNFDWR